MLQLLVPVPWEMGLLIRLHKAEFKVQLIDISEASLKRGMETITKNLDRMIAKEKIF